MIDGGNDSDTLSLTASGDQIIQLGDTLLNNGENYTVNNIETINADGTSDNTTANTLRAAAGDNDWTVSDANDGSVGSVTFRNFANLEGNSGIDTFNINAGSGENIINVNNPDSVSGTILGGINSDILTVAGTVANEITG